MNDVVKEELISWIQFMDLQERPPMRCFGTHKYLKFVPFKRKTRIIKCYAKYHGCSFKDAAKMVNILNTFYIQNKTMMDNKFKVITISITNTNEFKEYFSKYVNLDEIEFVNYFPKRLQ